MLQRVGGQVSRWAGGQPTVRVCHRAACRPGAPAPAPSQRESLLLLLGSVPLRAAPCSTTYSAAPGAQLARHRVNSVTVRKFLLLFLLPLFTQVDFFYPLTT